MGKPVSGPDLSNTRVLLIDDKPPSRDMLSQLLAGLRPKRLKPCDTIGEARILIATDPFDLILIDFALPDQDGIELARHIRSDTGLPNHATPIIVLHDHTPVEMIVRARDAGVNTVIRKPIAPAVLRGQIEWIARSGRAFITADTYAGPDRRFRRMPLPEGVVERRAEALALMASPERALSQDEVSSLFG